MDEFPNELKEYILNFVDVQADGNCGYKAIIATLGQG